MTTIHDFFVFEPLPVYSASNLADPSGQSGEYFPWNSLIDYWKSTYSTKQDFLNGFVGGLPDYGPYYYNGAFLLGLGTTLNMPDPSWAFGNMAGCVKGDLIPNATCARSPALSGQPKPWAYENVTITQNIWQYVVGNNYHTQTIANQINSSCGAPDPYCFSSAASQQGNIYSAAITGNESDTNKTSFYFEYHFNGINQFPDSIPFFTWDYGSGQRTQLKTLTNGNALADYLYGSPSPSDGKVFGMSYPPANSGPTDILVPNWVRPAQNTRIPFQNYTFNVPNFRLSSKR